VQVKHTFVSPKADGADATLVRPSDWNADHSVVFSVSAAIKAPAVDDFFVWRAPYACTLMNLRAYQDVGSGSTINAFGGSLASPTLFRSSNYAITAADAVEDAGTLQNTNISAGDRIYFRVAGVAGSPNEIGIQLDLTRP
jgi:hypothetical protein